ncbi:MAG: hypothetical protein COV67_10260 [Nitrospinae bacterium CG11_big_fil_rev_8_21_14_0_20_56_8]|nr:MAG: hypothetical protein COV67_10260 [Nitrospinae bacterium CG11_big_fil_rev_8_21_14_0_20_56_8]
MVNQFIRISGGNRGLFEYANRLSVLGHEVRWFVMPPRIKWYRMDKKWAAWSKGVEVFPPSTVDWMENRIPIEILQMARPGLLPEADVFVATAWQTAQFAARLAPGAGQKFYFVQHHESIWVRDRSQADSTYRLPYRIIVISTWLKDLMKTQYNQDAQVLVTPVNRDVFYPEGRARLTPLRVCMLHHDYDWKGYRDGIRAVQTAREAGTEVELVVFGEKLEDPAPLFRDAGFEFEYHYRPTKDHLRRVYSSSDVYLCPSWYEGLGMPAMEAMACGAALVTTDTGGCRDYALHEETALVSPPRDPKALSLNLLRILRDEPLRLRLAERGTAKVLEFDWDANCRQLAEIFQEAVRDERS